MSKGCFFNSLCFLKSIYFMENSHSNILKLQKISKILLVKEKSQKNFPRLMSIYLNFTCLK